MILEAPWIAPALAWGVVLMLLSLIVVAAITRDGAGPFDYIATLLGSLAIGIAGALGAVQIYVSPDDLLAGPIATLNGIAIAIYLGVLLHIMDWPRWMRERF